MEHALTAIFALALIFLFKSPEVINSSSKKIWKILLIFILVCLLILGIVMLSTFIYLLWVASSESPNWKVWVSLLLLCFSGIVITYLSSITLLRLKRKLKE